ncbi:uncharacterized protein PV09_08912 [Verruconis gallopava]|uniref:54S ribosomal protein L27, mitochondrial n=1 Tax=Verruconis gallopava TaxID=253628 RepID=A0A0D1ZY15_9PEZI|nr:uncharacterized protein PV09_08912 [Verruconis gallopava]KIV99367.1 hypothetical protein PV09_08912 [Verruconis gallopava]
MLGPFHASEPLLARAARKLALTTKQTNKGYYKGTRSGNVGHFSYNPKRYYIYEIDWNKVRTFVKPKNLADSELHPFVAVRVRAPAAGNGKKKLSGKDFLSMVKELGTEIEGRP